MGGMGGGRRLCLRQKGVKQRNRQLGIVPVAGKSEQRRQGLERTSSLASGVSRRDIYSGKYSEPFIAIAPSSHSNDNTNNNHRATSLLHLLQEVRETSQLCRCRTTDLRNLQRFQQRVHFPVPLPPHQPTRWNPPAHCR